MFIIPLDNRREWYRYHHIFKELLQQRLSVELEPDQVAELHLKASDWFDGNGMLDEALHHALAAGDHDLAASIMIAGTRDVLNHEDRPTLERWLRLMPEETIQRNPGLLMIKAWALQFAWRLDQQVQVLEQIEALLADGAGASLPEDDLQILQGEILLPRAQQAYFSNQNALAIVMCRKIMDLVPPSWIFVHGGAMIYLGLSMQASGQAQEAERIMLDAYTNYSEKTNTYALFLLEALSFIYLNTCRFDQAWQMAQLQVQGAIQSGMPLMRYWAVWFLGVISYQRNELEAAEQNFTQIFENRYVAQISPYRDAVAGLALIHQIKGEWAEALRMVDMISQFDLEQRGSEDRRTRSLRARLMLLHGDLERAGDLADAFTGPPPDQAFLWLEEPQITRVRILLARGTDKDLDLARDVLNDLNEIAERTHNTRFKIEIMALRSLVWGALGETIAAESDLKQAVDLGRSGGFIRVFVDLGKPMKEMLNTLVNQDYKVETIHRVLADFPDEEKFLLTTKSPELPVFNPSDGNSYLTEPLTTRELEVLSLLQGPSSIKEISSKLNITYATAKRHTINIYGKLGVNQRWHAVARARELNIIPPR